MKLAKVSDRLFPTFPSFIDNLLSRDLMDWNNSNFSSTSSTIPAVNIKENNESFVIEVAAPGMNKEDFKVDLENNRLTVSAEKEEEKNESNDRYTRREFRYSSFRRQFNVPVETINGDQIQAAYKDGILTLTLPKREELKPKPARIIEIN